jgi:multiple antibiotic resistance protein
LGITVFDFMVAGGVILFVLAILDVMGARHAHDDEAGTIGIVPLGTPMIAGPALITTCILMANEYGIPATLISLLLNIMIAAFLFSHAQVLTRLLGPSGSAALSKITSLLLASIAFAVNLYVISYLARFVYYLLYVFMPPSPVALAGAPKTS